MLSFKVKLYTDRRIEGQRDRQATMKQYAQDLWVQGHKYILHVVG